MTESRWEQIKRLFNAAMEKPAGERNAFLAGACGDDAELRREVQSLIQSARPTQQVGPIRTGGAAEVLANATTASIPDPHAADRVGSMIARYKLLQIIGEGGFGTVYMAEQTEPVRRKVALKIIKPGMDSRAIVARFEAERQALAMMDHPHIARVLDGGVTPLTESGGGLPYFVMEYVVGDAVTRFADAHALSIAERLAVFQQVCSAVQHAHTKGIIHRDLKPANVLVSMVDGKPFAKVIDFGIAKATGAAGGRLTDMSFFTEHRQLIGTPEYMSPEQAEGSLDIDTRTDVYALGVLLYELLTGTTPIEGARLRSAAFDEMRRMIREDEPLAPSMKLSRSLDTLARTAAARKVEPARLSALVKGELDWIVLKALEKERARRYETPSALADDVRRHLAGEAVVAAPVSRAYRVRKFVRRNKGAVAAGAAIAATLLVGIAGTTWQWREAQNANSKLLGQRDRSEAAVGQMMSILTGGAVSGPAVSLDENTGKRQGEEDPLGYAIGMGLDMAKSLKAERDRLAAQTNAAKTALSEMFLASSKSAQGMATGLPAIPEIRGEPGVKLLPALVGDGTKANPHRFEFQKLDAAAQQATPIADDQLIPALADSAKNTLLRALEATDAAEWSAYTANIALAQAALAADDYPEARRTLAIAPKSKSGWERLLLEQQASTYAYARRIPISTVGLSTDGSSAFSYALNQRSIPTLTWWRTSDGTVKRLIDTPAGVPGRYKFERTASGFSSSWALRKQPAWASPNLEVLLGRQGLSELLVYDATADVVLPPSGDPALRDAAVAAGDDGALLLFGTRDGQVLCWTPREREPHSRFRVSDQPITAVAISPSKRVILAATAKGDLSSVDVSSGNPLSAIRAHKGAITAVSYSPDGMSVVSAADDGAVRVWSSDLSVLKADYRLNRRELQSLAVSPDSAWLAVASEWDVRVLGVTQPQVRFVIPQYWGEGTNVAAVRFTGDGRGLVIANDYASDGNSSEIALVDLSAEGGPRRELSGWQYGDASRWRLVVASILASSTNGSSGLSITTPDGTRRIVGGAEKTVRFYEAKEGKPTLPATAEQPEGVYREVAVFRMPEAVTNLQMTGDGTRLIIHLEGGSARVWDIRDPEERRKDLQAEWAERVPAGAYLDTLWASDRPDEKLRDAVINDASLSPLRRLVAAEMLEERLEDDRLAAEQAFETMKQAAVPAGVTTGATLAAEPASITAAVRSAAAAAELPKRVKARVIASAAGWEYKRPEATAEQKLAQENQQRRLTEATLTVERFQSWDTPNYPGDLADLERAVAARDELLGQGHAESAKARWMLGIYTFARGKDLDSERSGVSLMRKALTQYRDAAPLSDVTLGMQISLAQAQFWTGDLGGAEASVRRALTDVESDAASASPRLAFIFTSTDVGGSGFDPGFHGKTLLPTSFSYDYSQTLAANRDRILAENRKLLDTGLLESAMRTGTAISLTTEVKLDGSRLRYVNGSSSSVALARLAPTDARVYLPLAMHQYRGKRLAGALKAAQESVQRCIAAPPIDDGWRPSRCDPLLQQSMLALIRFTLSTADDAALAAAAEIDGKPNSLTGGKVLDREGHRAAAREALAKARALMAPAADGTPSPWANDEDAKALLAEAEALIESRPGKP